MKHIVKNVIYRSVFSSGSWYNLGMIPASGTLSVRTEDTDNGRLRTYELSVTARRDVSRTGDAALEGDLKLIVTLEDGLQARLGTDERPVRLKQELSETLRVSCTWQEPADSLE